MTANNISIPLYHVDLKRHNEQFSKRGYIQPSNEDGDWAGSGLYCWDNLGNAHYWMKHHNVNREKTILKFSLNTSEDFVLDLTEPEAAEEFKRLAKVLQPFVNKEVDFDDLTEKGAVINLVCSALQKLHDKGIQIGDLPPAFKVVKVVGYYNSAPERGYFKISGKQFKAPHVTLKTKTIYAIRDQTILSQPSLVE